MTDEREITVTVKLRWSGCRLIGPHRRIFGSVWRERGHDTWSAESFDHQNGEWRIFCIGRRFASEAEACAAVEAGVIDALGGENG